MGIALDGEEMRVQILTPDSKMPNLAAMKISAHHKALGDEVILNQPLLGGDLTYASILFDWMPITFHADIVGGPGYIWPNRLPTHWDELMPDYLLYPMMDYSLGYTFEWCPRRCPFCKVWRMQPPKIHRSIWKFHNPKFRRIALLNNNWLADPRWHDTFEEIWDAGLTVIDHSGFDARLMTNDMARSIAKTKWQGQIHLALDHPRDAEALKNAMGLLVGAGFRGERITVYILCNYWTTEAEDADRVRLVRSLGALPFVMPYRAAGTRKPKRLANFQRLASRPAAAKQIDWNRVTSWDIPLSAAATEGK